MRCAHAPAEAGAYRMGPLLWARSASCIAKDHGTRAACGLSNPDVGVWTYGNVGKNPSAFRSTPSVSALFGATFGSFAPANSGNNTDVNGVPPAPALRKMSTVSSNNLRPFGKPAEIGRAHV